jgi:hypothetical protein
MLGLAGDLDRAIEEQRRVGLRPAALKASKARSAPSVASATLASPPPSFSQSRRSALNGVGSTIPRISK